MPRRHLTLEEVGALIADMPEERLPEPRIARCTDIHGMPAVRVTWTVGERSVAVSSTTYRGGQVVIELRERLVHNHLTRTPRARLIDEVRLAAGWLFDQAVYSGGVLRPSWRDARPD